MAGAHYTTLTASGIAEEFAAIARDTPSAFGRYDTAQLNWQPNADNWSIAQCFDHLLKTNHAMMQAIGRKADPTLWQRLPFWPRVMGRMLVSSQAPGRKGKYKAHPTAIPASSDIEATILDRFVAWQGTGMAAVRGLGAEESRRIIVSPFLSQITYSVLDAWRLVAAHQRRHFEQARGVAEHPEFPGRR